MARSYRHTPIFGITTSSSEKQDKRIANRRLRRAARHAMQRGKEMLPTLREVSDVWSFDKDGRKYDRAAGAQAMRK
jgi:glycerol-3-phosphate dehydrogenase